MSHDHARQLLAVKQIPYAWIFMLHHQCHYQYGPVLLSRGQLIVLICPRKAKSLIARIVKFFGYIEKYIFSLSAVVLQYLQIQRVLKCDSLDLPGGSVPDT